MKRAAILLTTLLLILAACQESKPTYRLSGHYGNGGDTIYVFGLDSRHNRLDTLPTDNNGEFHYKLATDTLVPLTMILPDGRMLPLYAEPDVEAIFEAKDSGKTVIKGGTVQALYDSIAAKIDSTKGRVKKEDIIDEFIESHPMSEINIHLLQQYFIEIPDAKNPFIRTRLDKLGGTLQDNDYLADVKVKVSKKNSNIVHKAFPEFSLTTAEGKTITRNDFMGKYTIVTFWASWDSLSLNHLKELSKIARSNSDDKFALLNISLDHDTIAWHHCLERDTIAGENICDAQLWENCIVKEFNIEKLPFSIQMNPYMRIDRFGLTANEEFAANIDSLIEKHAKDEKRKEKNRIKKEQKIRVATSKDRDEIIKRGGLKNVNDVPPTKKIVKSGK